MRTGVRVRPGWVAPAVLLAALLAVVWVLASGRTFDRKLTISQFQQLPTGSIGNFEAKVTFVDSVEHRAWLQDETGAISIPLGASDSWLTAGKSVRVKAARGGRSGASKEVVVNATLSPSARNVQLPTPARISLRNWSEADQDGKRVQVSAVVREVTRDHSGRAVVSLADASWDTDGVIAEHDNGLEWLENSRVSVTGIPETVTDEHGAILGRKLLIQKAADIHVEDPAPKEIPEFSIRTLYQADLNSLGHRLRLRGKISALLTPQEMLIDDRWGTIMCQFSSPQTRKIGDAVEVDGYPVVDGLRVNLVHSTIRELNSAELPDSGDGAETLGKVTSIGALRRLSHSEAAAALPVEVDGVITYVDNDWKQMFIQKGGDAIYVKYPGSQQPLSAGDHVVLTGLSNPGNYAPIIVAPRIRNLGKGPLPPARAVKPLEAASGILDSQFVQVEGVVHPMKADEGAKHLTFELFSSVGQIHVFTAPTFGDAQQLRNVEDAKVRIRGVFGTVFNSRRQLVGYQLSISSPADISLLEPSTTHNFDTPVTPIANVLQFSPDSHVGHRIRVQGSVTMVGHDFFYVQDATGGLQVRTSPGVLNVGDVADVMGYASPGGGYSPVMEDAIVRYLGRYQPVHSISTDAETILQGQYDAQVVSVQGRLLAVVDSPFGKSLVLQSGGYTFGAQLDGFASTAELTEGSTVTVTGVCSVQVNSGKLYLLLREGAPLSFKILLRSPEDLVVVRPAPWWNIQRILFLAAGLVVAVVMTLGWVSVLRRRVRKQSEELQKAAETTQAIKDLAEAMRDVSEQEDLSARVSVRGKEEIAQLVVGFNRMLDELQLREAAKLEAESKLQQQALTDELTGLPNRRLLADRLEQTLASAQRDGRLVALLYIDLDGFKLVNDSLGHTIGDLLLSQVAQRLRSRIRYSDTLARLGGDEFTVVLTRARKKEDAEFVANNLLESLSTPFVIEGHEIRIGASIGASLFPENGTSGTDLLQQADSAMYAAKRNGKNQVMFFTETLGSSVRERLTLENELSNAVANGEITLHYQPEFEISTGQLIRFEALARWTHPTLGAIPPAKFIPVAEDSGLIISLGAYVMEKACEQAVSWQRISANPVQVAVNVSSIQFARESFVNEVLAILAKTGLRAELLQIELTESAMLNGVERVATAIQKLRDAGVTVAIDDFGTGYSCLSYLPRLSFDALKIDRSFVRELGTRPETKAMVHALVTLAHNLGMKVIVEGIETPEQLREVKALGGNEVQGFLLGHPNADPAATLEEHSTRGTEAMRSEVQEPSTIVN